MKDCCPYDRYPTRAALIYAARQAGLVGQDNRLYRPGHSMLADGEYDRPDYVPTRYWDGWALKMIAHYHAGTLQAQNGERVSLDEIFEVV